MKCGVCQSNGRFDLLWVTPSVRMLPRGDVAAPYDDRFCGLFVCGTCRAPAFIEMQLIRDDMKSWGGPPSRVLNRIHRVDPAARGREQMDYAISAIGPLRLNDLVKIERIYGEEAQPPMHLPASIEQTWRDELLRPLTPRLKAIVCRMLLDQICKDLQATGANLSKQLDSLTPRLSPAIVEWAHEVRLLGNVAVHDASVEIEDADAHELVEFTRIVAELLYTVPTRVRALREKREKQ